MLICCTQIKFTTLIFIYSFNMQKNKINNLQKVYKACVYRGGNVKSYCKSNTNIVKYVHDKEKFKDISGYH